MWLILLLEWCWMQWCKTKCTKVVALLWSFLLHLSVLTCLHNLHVYTYIYNNNDNNRLFMVSHLVRAQSTYKDIRIHLFHHACMHRHTHTNTQTYVEYLQADGSISRLGSLLHGLGLLLQHLTPGILCLRHCLQQDERAIYECSLMPPTPPLMR